MREMSLAPVLRRALAHVAWLSALLAGPIAAQQGDQWDFRSPSIARSQLERLLARYDAAAQSTVYSDGLRASARANADAIRTRLRDGDVRVGDRIRIIVEGQSQLTDTAAIVSTGPALFMPGVGSVPLSGVLRSEIEAQLTRAVNRVYRGGTVRAQLLTRVAVTGGVPRPGFYPMPAESRVEDAITAAGGLAGNVQLRGVYVERGSHRLWQSDSLQAAMQDARSLADLGIQDGDRIVVPNPVAPRDPYRTMQLLTFALSLPITLFALGRLLKL